MPKSRGRKPKKKRAPASASKKGLDNFNTTPQELPLSTQPPQGPQPATAPTGTRGFAAPEDCSVAVCVLPGTELAFETPVKYQTILMLCANTGHTVAIFRQINKGARHINHDALEFPMARSCC